MNTKNLPLKFLSLGLAVALCAYSLWAYGLKYGIDLRGGHSLTYAVRTNASTIATMEDKIKQDEAKAAASKDPAEKKSLQDAIDRTKAEVSRLRSNSGDDSNLVERMIAVLKDRLDPNGLRSLEWVPMGRDRFEVRMPAGSKETGDLKNKYILAMENLDRNNLQRSQIQRIISTAKVDDRATEIAAAAGSSKALADGLTKLALLHDALLDAQGQLAEIQKSPGTPTAPSTAPTTAPASEKTPLEKANAAVIDRSFEYNTELKTVLDGNVSPQRLTSILNNYVSKSEAAVIKDKEDIRKKREAFEDGLNELKKKHPDRADIDKAVAAYKEWSETRQQLEDPSDLKRLIARAGVLEYRLAPTDPASRATSGGESKLDADLLGRFEQELKDEGPDAGRRRNEAYLWFPMRDKEYSSAMIVREYLGQNYVLLSSKPNEVMLQDRGGLEGWALADAFPERDNMGRPGIGFRFDDRGASRFFSLTSQHIGWYMAILLDDVVYSAPTINAAISDRGIIEGRFTEAEVSELVRTFQAGSLPAKLDPNPIAESTFGPGIGQENLDMGFHAGMWALIIVAGFMLVYYRFSGVIADIALILNLVLVLGAMSMMSAVLTLPGIAGIILSIGMAVDANVLIYERLREEQAKGQSIRMSLKNAYEKAFSAIFDSNLTTLISCLILGWVGTQEVRGFAITLGLGVLFNLFTAVFATRWLFQVLLESGIVKQTFKMMHLIRTPKIDWMGKRYYFWAFSIATGILGIVSLFWQSGDIWGIEFSAGTKATLVFKDDVMIGAPGKARVLDDGLVRDLFIAKAREHNMGKLVDTVRVETIINSNAADQFLQAHFPGKDVITLDEWKTASLNSAFFKEMDGNSDGKVTRDELKSRLPQTRYQVTTTETAVGKIQQVAAEAFSNALVVSTKLQYKFAPAFDKDGNIVPQTVLGMKLTGTATPLTPKVAEGADQNFQSQVQEYIGGVMFVVEKVEPAITQADLTSRLNQVRLQSGSVQVINPSEVIGLAAVTGEKTYTSFVVLVRPADTVIEDDPQAMKEFAASEQGVLGGALELSQAIVVTNFDPALAGDTASSAVWAMVMAWLAMIIYLWIRFGRARWGVAAVVCLVHDTVIVTGLVAVSGWLSQTLLGRYLMIDSFKIDLTMVTAILTIIGYSVNDTIVVFDRIRENRGKLIAVSSQTINNSINQTLSRTLLTSMTVLMVVVIMYVWGGPGLHSFNYAMLAGVLFGTYSSIAVAAPILLGFKEMIMQKAVDSTPDKV